MADDISQIVDGLRIITAQKSIEDEAAGTKTKGKKGVIIDSKAGNKKSREKEKPVSATLTSNETTRYTKIFEILRNVINPDPEAARTGDTAKDKVKGMSATTEGAAGAKEAEEGLLEKLGALGALLATLGPLLWGLIKKKFFEYMGKFLKFLKRSFVKLLKGIGRLMLRFGKFLWKSAKKAAKAIWRGLKNVGKRLLGFLKNTASKVGGAIKGMFSALWNSKWATALKGAVKGAFNAMKGFLSKAVNMVKGGAKAVTASASAAASAASGGGGSSRNWFQRNIIDKGSNLVKSGIDKTKSAIKTTVKAVKAAPGAATRFVKNVARSGVDLVKSGVKYTKGAVQYVGGKILKGVGQAKTALGKVLKPALKTGSRKLLTKIPIVGSALEAAFTAYDVNKYADNPELGIEELKTKIGNRVVKGIGGVAGGAMAAALVNGVPGGILVSIPAYMIGDALGRFVVGQLTEVFPMTKLGGVVMDAFGITPATSPEEVKSQVKKVKAQNVDDGVITHGGQTVRINSKDDVLALKTGGPLDSMFKSRDSNGIQDAAVFNDIKSVNIAQLQILTSIRDGIMALGALGTGKVSNSSGPSKVKFRDNIATKEYYGKTKANFA